jgi:hypothetical protein
VQMQPHDTSLPVTKVQRFIIRNVISGICFQEEQEHITGRSHPFTNLQQYCSKCDEFWHNSLYTQCSIKQEFKIDTF